MAGLGIALAAAPSARGVSSWAVRLDEPAQESSPYHVFGTRDGGFVGVATTRSQGGDVWLFKLDAVGVLQWERFLEHAGEQRCFSGTELASGDLVFVGETRVLPVGTQDDGWMLRLTAAGDVTWQRGLDSGATDYADWVAATDDGGFVTCGNFPGPLGSGNALLKADADGDLEWVQGYNQIGTSGPAYKVLPRPGGYAVISATSEAGVGRGWLYELDLAGDFVRQWSYGEPTGKRVRFRGFCERSAGYFVAGSITDGVGLPEDVLVLALDDDGDVAWQRRLHASSGDVSVDVAATADGGCLVLADTNSFGARHAWFLRFAADGTLLWQRRLSDWSAATGLQPAVDGGFVASANSAFAGGAIYILRLDEDGGLVSACAPVTTTTASVSTPAVASYLKTATVAPPPLTITDTTATPLARTSFVHCSACPVLACTAVDADPPIACSGEAQTLAVTISGGIGPFGVSWDFDGDTVVDATGTPASAILPPGVSNGVVTVTDTCNPVQSCMKAFSTEVVAPLACGPSAVNPTATCFGAAQSFSVTWTGGKGPVEVAWDFDGDTVTDAIGSPVSALLPPGAWNGSVTLTDACSPAATCTQGVTASVGSELSCGLPTSDPPIACPGTSQRWEVTWLGGEAPVGITWDFDGDTIVDATGTPALSTLPAGVWNGVMALIDGCVPAQSCSRPIVSRVAPVLACDAVTIDPPEACAGASQSLAVGWLGGLDPVSVEWDFDGDTTVDAAGATVTTNLGVGAWDGVVRVTDACGAPAGCSLPFSTRVGEALACQPPSVDPPRACEGTPQSFAIAWLGGLDPVAVSWDFDGDTLEDAAGTPVTTTLPPGTWTGTVILSDGCAAAQVCSQPVMAEVLPAPALGEVSDVLAGDAPLRVDRASVTVAFEPDATAYHAYVDRIGSWYAPTAATGSACSVPWADSGGRVTLALDLPAGSWVDVSAAHACGEGPLGHDSFGASRTDAGAWTRCGAAP